MITNTGLLSEINTTQRSLSIFGSKLKCCQDNKKVYWYCPTSAPMLMNPIQTPVVHIKQCQDMDYHLLGTWTMECTRRNCTTENQTSPSLYFLDWVKFDILWLAKCWFTFDRLYWFRIDGPVLLGDQCFVLESWLFRWQEYLIT